MAFGRQRSELCICSQDLGVEPEFATSASFWYWLLAVHWKHTAKTCVGPNPTELLCEGTQFTGSFPIVFSAYQSYRNLG